MFMTDIWNKHIVPVPNRNCRDSGALLRPAEGGRVLAIGDWSLVIHAKRGLPHEAGLKLLKAPCAPRELPVSALLRNAQGVVEWKLFLNE